VEPYELLIGEDGSPFACLRLFTAIRAFHASLVSLRVFLSLLRNILDRRTVSLFLINFRLQNSVLISLLLLSDDTELQLVVVVHDNAEFSKLGLLSFIDES
jgi:hypothetical protein